VVGIVLSAASVFFLPSATLSEPVREASLLFEEVLATVESEFVDEVDIDRLFNTGVSAALRTLDPYTEFEAPQAARDLKEQVSGKYGGVGLVIAPDRSPPRSASPASPAMPSGRDGRTDGRGGAVVVNAFEGYAYDSGLRVGDHLVTIDGKVVSKSSVDEIRDLLRGLPDTAVKIEYIRDGIRDGPTAERAPTPSLSTVTLRRRLVKVPDVRLATLLDAPHERTGYIQLGGFGENAAREIRETLGQLQLESARAHNGLGLQGLILDLRSNPGGLLSSAVEVTSGLVPRGSTLVSASGRGFPRVVYQSDLEPLRDVDQLPLAVLVNGGTASAAEIVSGAVQDLDVGVIVGSSRTFGKGLVQNVETLPFSSALKYTVGRYYTPSGRCIQAINYRRGSAPAAAPRDTSTPGADAGSATETVDPGEPQGNEESRLRPSAPPQAMESDEDGDENSDGATFRIDEVPESARKQFRTKHGRVVRDGGGIEPDVKVASPEVRPLQSALISSGIFFDFAGDWAKHHDINQYLSGSAPGTVKLSRPLVDASTLSEFRRFAEKQIDEGKLKLGGGYVSELRRLEDAMERAGLENTERSLAIARQTLNTELKRDFNERSGELRQQLELAILSRYLPESEVRQIAITMDEPTAGSSTPGLPREINQSVPQGTCAR
jgi:carboxyl-terminal processing protease